MLTESEVKKMFGIKPDRTKKQNRAMHLAFTLLAQSLNGAGLPMNKVLKVDIDWTPESVKEYLFRPIMKAMVCKDSTTELDTKQISDVWNTLMHNLGEKKGIEYIPFPSEEELGFKKTLNQNY